MTKEELAFIEWLKSASEQELRREMRAVDNQIFRDKSPSGRHDRREESF